MQRAALRTVPRFAVPPADDAEAIATNTHPHASIEPQLYLEHDVDGSMEFSRLGWLSIARVRSGPHRTVHHPRSVGDNEVHVVLQTGGASELQQRGHSLDLPSDRWIALSADQPYTIISRVRTERIILTIGLQHLVDHVLSRIIGRAYALRGAGRVLSSSLSSLIDELKVIRLSDTREVAEYLTLMLQLVMRNEIAPVLHKQPVRLEQVQDFVARHLRDPNLKPSYIAEHLSCSLRTLSRLMAGSGYTLMEYIYSQRLACIREELMQPVLPHLSLSELALAWGFSDYSHFLDRFRALFGITPNALRRQALNAPESDEMRSTQPASELSADPPHP